MSDKKPSLTVVTTLSRTKNGKPFVRSHIDKSTTSKAEKVATSAGRCACGNTKSFAYKTCVACNEKSKSGK